MAENDELDMVMTKENYNGCAVKLINDFNRKDKVRIGATRNNQNAMFDLAGKMFVFGVEITKRYEYDIKNGKGLKGLCIELTLK